MLVAVVVCGAVAFLTQGCNEKSDSEKNHDGGSTPDHGTGGTSDASAGGPSSGGRGGSGGSGAGQSASDASLGGGTSNTGGTSGADAGGDAADSRPPTDVDAGPELPLGPEVGKVTAMGADAPSITAVYASRLGQNLHLELDGTGFGNAPSPMPLVSDLNQFKFTDTMAAWCAGGAGCPVVLQYTSWTDTKIVIDGFGHEYGGQYVLTPGDGVSISVMRDNQNSVTWTGNLEQERPPPLTPGAPNPQFGAVAFSRIGQNLHLEVHGAGFGNEPSPMPLVSDLNQFAFTDATTGGWCAGGAGCAVQLQYTSWSDTEIVVDGFGHEYGGQHRVAKNDEVSILVQNSHGPEFAIWTGLLKESAPPEPHPDDPTPQVATVTFSQIGQGMHIQIDGNGFGAGPTTLPANIDLNQFAFTDVTAGQWCAGGAGCPLTCWRAREGAEI